MQLADTRAGGRGASHVDHSAPPILADDLRCHPAHVEPRGGLQNVGADPTTVLQEAKWNPVVLANDRFLVIGQVGGSDLRGLPRVHTLTSSKARWNTTVRSSNPPSLNALPQPLPGGTVPSRRGSVRLSFDRSVRSCPIGVPHPNRIPNLAVMSYMSRRCDSADQAGPTPPRRGRSRRCGRRGSCWVKLIPRTRFRADRRSKRRR